MLACWHHRFRVGYNLLGTVCVFKNLRDLLLPKAPACSILTAACSWPGHAQREGTLVLEEVDLLGLPAHVEVVRELALEALRALPRLEVLAHNGFGIHAWA